ncbi:MAG: GspE/PulE family protein [Candidatus Saccharimonadales bacterium]
MRISDTLTEILLKRSGKFSKKELNDLHKRSASSKKPLQDIVVQENLITETELARMYAEEMNIPFIVLPAGMIEHHVLHRLPEHVSSRYNAVVFNIDEDDGSVHIAMEDPFDEEALLFIRKIVGDNIRPHLTSPTLLRAAHDQYRAARSSDQLGILSRKVRVNELQKTETNAISNEPAIAASVNYIIEEAIRRRATDIHIEPHIDRVVIRYRIDGLLHQMNALPLRTLPYLSGYIKSQAGLSLSESELPQYGTWYISGKDSSYSLRVAVAPMIDGEKISIHIRQQLNSAPSLRDIGLWGDSLNEVHKAIVQPHGLVMVAGHTGSGISTSLYSFLNAVNSPHIHIATVEDPIEHSLPGATQLEVNEGVGLTFERGLQAVLEHNPNVLMISSINDNHVIQMVLAAATRGQLVFGGIHAPSATVALKRVVDLGAEPHSIVSVSRGIISQRLIRKLCPYCREVIRPDAKLLKKIDSFSMMDKLGGIKKLHAAEKQAFDEGLGLETSGTKLQQSKELSTTGREILHLWKAHEGGCEHCHGAGYKGRVGIFEILVPNDAVLKALVSNGSKATIEKAALDSGMIPLGYDGLVKALRGVTSIEEVERVVSKNL